jgi:poly(3-hydroxyalkanoate) depolymerase
MATATARAPRAQATSPAPLEISYREVDGARLRVATTRPEDPAEVPLLVLNGIGASLELLEGLARSLSRFRVILFDLPGLGGSSPAIVPRRFAGLARLVRELLAELGEPRVDVMGVSWGGALAQQVALQYPGACRRLVLAATSTGHLMVPPRLDVLLHMSTPLRYFSASYFASVAGTIYGGDFRRDRALARRHARLMAPPSLAGYLAQLFALTGWTSFFRLAAIAQPTLVLAGEDDPLILPINARILASGIPRARLRFFDCGHLFLLTRMDAVVEEITGFLENEEIDAGGP